jgi:hypothetical protein
MRFMAVVQVGRVKAEYSRLEAKLKSHLLDIEKREPRLALAEKEIERERERMRKDMEHNEKSRAEETQRVCSKYRNDLVNELTANPSTYSNAW